ncbi:MAG: ribonuclease H-like domain-containing protein [Candidatus Thermoplasmatota archaeon]
MRVLHLPEKAVGNHTEKEIRDLDRYFSSDLTIASGFKKGRRKLLDKATSYETIFLEEIRDYKIRNLKDEFLVIIRNEEAVDELLDREDTVAEKNIMVVTDLIKEEMDRSSFDYRLKNTSIIDRLSKKLENYHLFSTEIEAGKKQVHGNKFIRGLGPCFDREGVKIAFLSSGEGLRVKPFPADRVGLLAIPDLGKKFSALLSNQGIEDRRALKECDPKELMNYDGVGPYRCTKWVCAAEAIEEKSVYRIQDNELEDKHKIYLDIETDSLRPSVIWHIGLYDDSKGEYLSFLEKEPKKKDRIVKKFGSYLEKNRSSDTALLAWYGSGFDFKVLEDFFEKYGRKFLDNWHQTDKVDLMRWVKSHAVMSCRTSKLEDVAECLGYERGGDSLELSGEEVAQKYSDYMTGRGEEPDWGALKEYAKDDVISLKHIYEVISDAPIKYDLKEMKKMYRRSRS